MGYDSDPRFSGPAHYDRQECIDAVTDLYHFLIELPYIQPDQILYPPAGGWPNVTKELLEPMGKSDEVVELLAHLPYICVQTERQPWEPSKEWVQVAPSTHLIDYRGSGVRDMMGKGEKFNETFDAVLPPWFSPPPHVVSLTTGKKNGDWLLLDTSDGTVTRWTSDCISDEDEIPFPDENSYEVSDSRHWRDRCTSKTLPIGQYLDMLKKQLRDFTFIAHLRSGLPRVKLAIEHPERESEELKAIYKRHGWPNVFQRDACRNELLQWGEGKHTY